MIPSLPPHPNLADVLRAFPGGWSALLDAHDTILRAESPLTIGERELTAAYVSGLNGCAFCWNAHTVYAESYGFSLAQCEAVLADVATAPIPERLRPVLAYARELTRAPSRMQAAYAQAILNAGWTEQAVMDTAMVVALFNFMNRVVLGTGVAPHDEYYARRRAVIAAQPLNERESANARDVGTHPYRAYGRQLGIVV